MRKLLSILVVVQFVIVMSAFSYAASGKCTVVGVEKSQITLNCSKKNGTFRVKDKIKIKSIKPKNVEGC